MAGTSQWRAWRLPMPRWRYNAPVGNRAFARLVKGRGQPAGRAMLQRVWMADTPGIEKWDKPVNRRIWFYNKNSKQYCYQPEEGAKAPEGADEDWAADLVKYKGKERPFHHWAEWINDDMKHPEDQPEKSPAPKPELATDIQPVG